MNCEWAKGTFLPTETDSEKVKNTGVGLRGPTRAWANEWFPKNPLLGRRRPCIPLAAFSCNHWLRQAGARRGLEVELSCAKSGPWQIFTPAAPAVSRLL